jgi:vacuolar-type H+-ATPase subunit H
MLAIKETLQVGDGVFAHSLSDYRLKVEDIIRTENVKFRKLAEEQARVIIDRAYQQEEEIIRGSQKKASEIIAESEGKASEIIAESEKKAEKIIEDSQEHTLKISNEIQQQANQKYSEITNEAQQKAQQVIQEAEEKIKEEAKKRVKSEEEKILSKAREEARSIIADMKEKAEKEKYEIIEGAKKEAVQRVEEEVAKFHAEAQAQSAHIRDEAEKKAANLINAIIDSNKEVNDLIIKTIRNSETTLEKMKNEMNTEAGELTKNIVTVGNRQKPTEIPTIADKSEGDMILRKNYKKPNKNQVVWVALEGEKSAKRDDNTYLFKGQIKLKAFSSMPYTVVKNMRNYFNQVPNVKYLGESCTDEVYILEFEMKEPLPLIDILRNIPSVEKVETQKDSLKLILN